MAEKNKITPFEKELSEIAKEVRKFKNNAEANIIAIIYKNPEVLLHTNLSTDEFSDDMAKVYFEIAKGVISEGKKTLDDMTVAFYLEKHPKLSKKYDEYGGYEKVDAQKDSVEAENFDGYVSEMRKWNVVARLAKAGFPVKSRMSEFADMSAEEIYNEFETFLNHTFINIDSEVKSYNAFEGINELINELDAGSKVGMPLYNAPLLTNEIAGINPGHIYGLGAGSGCGKSTMAFNYLVPSAIEYGRQLVFIINEEDQTKFQQEMIVWVANNILNKDLQKYTLRNGHFDNDTMELLRQCADWIESRKDDRTLTIIPLERYSVNTVVKIINKYSALNPDTIFCLDTLKESVDAKTDEIYKSMMRDMVKLYDTIKPASKNVALFVTYQLGKNSIKLRHLTNAEIGQARSIVDVMSVNLMMRRPYDDEYEGMSKELYCWRYDNGEANGNQKKGQLQYKMKMADNPMITFVTKNRFGITDQYQIVSSCDLSKNEVKDIAYCFVPQDF